MVRTTACSQGYRTALAVLCCFALLRTSASLCFNPLSLAVTNLPPHTDVKISFLFWKIDSWDGELFKVFIDSDEVHSQQNFYYQGLNLFGNGNSQSGWLDDSYPISITRTHDADAVLFGFQDTLDQEARDESWGIDNVKVEVILPGGESQIVYETDFTSSNLADYSMWSYSGMNIPSPRTIPFFTYNNNQFFGGWSSGPSSVPMCTPTCTDNMRNGAETGVDCGGSCDPCATCTDNEENGNEEGVDCGGPDCAACPTCDDGVRNQGEEDIDCGGDNCIACPTCDDNLENGDEVGIDCGGSCAQDCACTETQGLICHELADCFLIGTTGSIPSGTNIVTAGVSFPTGSDQYACSCPSEQLGHGYGLNGCSTTGWSVRVVYQNIAHLEQGDVDDLLELMGGITCTPGSTNGCDHIHFTVHPQYLPQVGANVLFPKTEAGKIAADAAAFAFNSAAPAPARRNGATYPSRVDPKVGARVYAWTAGTTSDPIQVLPAGMQVDTVQFEPACALTGCWVIDVKFTVGHSDVKVEGMPMGYNTFYLPYAVGSDTLSYDYPYGSAVENTYEPANFPCFPGGDLCCFGTQFGAATTPGGAPNDGVLGKYRVTNNFASYAATYGNDANCATTKPEDVEPSHSTAQGFFAQGQKFVGMGDSPGFTSLTVDDAFVGMFSATIKLDEEELRTMAGILKGTVGVEHTVDMFLGYANFKPATTTTVLDAFASQTAIHLEKTSFFSVSTHGTNDYTFLEYVNLRLVTIYKQDIDFSETTDEFADRTDRTNSADAAQYVQVTFTLGNQYAANANTGIVPIDSVRVGQGTFFSEDGVQQHACAQWDPAFTDYTFDKKTMFEGRLIQDCAPAADMCTNPTSIPDQFVSFNVPLGIDWLMDPEDDLSANVFVHMVISAIDTGASGGTPNSGDPAQQMKTTLSASIPIVEGGLNIFCDGLVAKTDLEDVATVDLILGSAATEDELSRLTIFKDIANSGLDRTPSQVIDTDSIEAGLMTLVVIGDDDYFNENSGTAAYSLELEDAITIHIMEDGTAKSDYVEGLIEEYPDDNDGEFDGYYLNGAFRFRVNRQENRAHLEPTSELLQECAFSPAAPSTGNAVRETCVVRRDVRLRAYPHRPGGWSTAMEIAVVDYTGDEEARFFQTMLGSSDYSRKLGRDFADVVDTEYDLNGRYKRAWWINPAYEWTPTQTQGESIFTLSQKIFMFALINLNENYNDVYSDGCYNLPDSIKLGNKCFFSPGGMYNYADSRLQCQQYGGDLAIINSREEDELAQQMMTAASMGNCWIGADDIDVEGQWKWIDGSSVNSGKAWNGPYGTYSNWNSGEPNNAGNEDCLHIYSSSDSWNDLPCSSVHNYVCSIVDNAIEKPQLHLPPLPTRRMLLSSTPSKETGAGVSAMKIETKTSRKTMMANAFNVPEDKVATFSLTVAVSDAEACLPLADLQASVRGSLEEQVAAHASPFETLQVLSLTLHRDGITCPSDGPATRRSSQRVLLSAGASVDVEMLLVFSPGTSPQVDLEQIKQLSGVTAAAALDVSPKVALETPETTQKDEAEEEKTAAAAKEEEGSGGNLLPIIAGVVGGVVGLGVIAGVAFLWTKKRETDAMQPVAAVAIEDLKSQLASDV